MIYKGYFKNTKSQLGAAYFVCLGGYDLIFAISSDPDVFFWGYEESNWQQAGNDNLPIIDAAAYRKKCEHAEHEGLNLTDLCE